MEISAHSGTGLRPASPDTAPKHIADLRPTADAAALAKEPQPHLPMPPSTAQVAAVVQAFVPTAPARQDKPGTALMPGISAAERLLKPYGIEMLPPRTMETARDPETSL